MSISDTRIAKKAAKTAFVYLLAAVFCALFGAIYELFSHQVYSFFMLYAFAFPLVGGALPFLLICLRDGQIYPGRISRNLYHSGIATFTVGSIIRGVLDIYGTSNSLARWYWYAGGILTAAGILLFLFQVLVRDGKTT